MYRRDLQIKTVESEDGLLYRVYILKGWVIARVLIPAQWRE